jgi:hypothetical protein
MIFCVITESFGRGGVKLYSIGNNVAWNTSGSWSLTVNGKACDFVPQCDDTIIIDHTMVQNVSFSFSGNGRLEVMTTGILRGDNVNLNFAGDAVLKCDGELKINNLNLNGKSFLLVESNGTLLIKSSCVNNSSADHIVSGKLSVTGSLTVGSQVKMKGIGTIESVKYDGIGSVMGVSPASTISDGSKITEFNWIGTLNSNWNDPSNWSNSTVPGLNSNVSILSAVNNPEISAKAAANNLYVNSDASVTVFPEAIININGNLEVKGAGKFILKNTTSKKSSLILNGETSGNIQSEYPVLKGQKNLISSPVEAAYSKTFLNMYLRTYDESASNWGNYIVPTNDPLQVMQGYEVYSLSTDTKTFEGTPDQESKAYQISNSGNGLNLTGNPYPCYIDWENNDNNAWQRNSIASAIYYPDLSGSGNYSVYLPGGDDAVSLNNGSRFIAPMQGFFVKAQNEGSLVVTKNSRVSSITETKHVIKNNSIKFKLNESAGSTDEVLFRVLENSTFDFDNNFDAIKLQNVTDSPYIYLQSTDDTKFAVNTIPSISSSTNIPLNIVCKKDGQFTLTVSGVSGFEYRYPVILEDKELQKFIDLRADSVYTFSQTAEMNSNRFELHFYSPEGVDEQAIEPVSEVAVVPGEITINGTSSDNTVYTANLFSVDGKLLSTSKGSLAQGISLSTGNQPAGVCVLQLNDGKRTITKKIFTK